MAAYLDAEEQGMETVVLDPSEMAAYLDAEEKGIRRMLSRSQSTQNHDDHGHAEEIRETASSEGESEVEYVDEDVLNFMERIDADQERLAFDEMMKYVSLLPDGALRSRPILVEDCEIEHSDKYIACNVVEPTSARHPAKRKRSGPPESDSLRAALNIVSPTEEDQWRSAAQLYISKFAVPAMRLCFHEHWHACEGRRWADTPACGRAYAARETAFRFCMRPTKDLLHAGDSARWDVSALGFILLRSSVHPLSNGSADRDCVAHIAALRNSLCHNREVPPGACRGLCSAILAFAARHGVYVPDEHDASAL